MSETCAECIHPRIDHEHYGCELCDCDRPYGHRPNAHERGPLMDQRTGFFPNGQCRHYWLVDGWAKIWCVRTEDGHTEHETEAGMRWNHENGSTK